MDEQDFEWAQRYLIQLGYRVEENLATQGFSILQRDESLADTAVIKGDGSMLVSYQVTTPQGTKKILRPQQIVVIAMSCHEQHSNILK